LDEAISHERRISYSLKLAIFSEILAKDEKARYQDLYNQLKFKFSDLTRKEFTFLKYL
jgi:hypothetical protein